MPIKNIVSDWNGTLISYTTEGKLMENIGLAILKNSGFRHPVKSADLVVDMFHLKDLDKDCKAGKIEYGCIYDYFNDNVFCGTPDGIVRSAVEKYAAKAAEKIDMHLLKAIEDLHSNGNTGILSTGYSDGIIKTLSGIGIVPFHTITANDIEWNNGKAIKFNLNIYNNKEKFLEDVFLKEHGYRPDETAYIGDTEEDEKCFEMVKYPIASFFATDGFKQHSSGKYDAIRRGKTWGLRENNKKSRLNTFL